MTPTQTTYLILIICAVGAVALIVGLWVMIALFRLVQDLRGKPPHPPNEQLQQSHEQIVHRVTNLENWRTDLTQKLEQDKKEIILSGSQRGRTIYQKMEEDRRELDAKIQAVDDKIDAIPERIVNMLKNIKGLS